MPKINLLDFTRAELRAMLVALKEKPFRADQLMRWVHQLGITDFTQMTNFSLELRTYLQEHAEVVAPKIVSEQKSSDGVRKWLMQLADGNHIETVFIPEGHRGTLCISSQVGCPLKCGFCETGKLGFKRNLDLSEIIGQLWQAVRLLSPDKSVKHHVITNVVFMGMGEPLLNLKNVLRALDVMLDDFAYGLSKYRVTVSTSGLVPEMRELSSKSEVAFAVSLHAVSDKLRERLMPINKKYPLKELIAACDKYYKDQRRIVTIEYIMIKDVNDSVEEAKALAKLLRHGHYKINLIPCNVGKTAGPFLPSSQRQIDAFRQVLLNAGLNTITRRSRGSDIAAACGQLAGEERRLGQELAVASSDPTFEF